MRTNLNNLSGEKEAFIKQKYEVLAYAPNRTFPRLQAMASMSSASKQPQKNICRSDFGNQRIINRLGRQQKEIEYTDYEARILGEKRKLGEELEETLFHPHGRLLVLF